MDEVLPCGCRWEDRNPGPLPDTQEFVPEIDCPTHGEAAGYPWGPKAKADGNERPDG